MQKQFNFQTGKLFNIFTATGEYSTPDLVCKQMYPSLRFSHSMNVRSIYPTLTLHWLLL